MKWGVEMKAAYCTLGCKVNQYDTLAMQELLEEAGFETVDFEEPAQVYLINTCTVTGVADKKSRQMIRRAKGHNPDAVVCVCGCLSQRAPEALLAQGADAVVGVQGRNQIVEVVNRALAGEKVNAVADMGDSRDFEELEIHQRGQRIRANLKICEGCDNFCSYCIIPYARGRVRSRKLAYIEAEAARLAAHGTREIVLTGIHIGSYGKDLEGVSLADVVETVGRIDGIQRIRLGSLEPSAITPAFCVRMARVSPLCPHFHLSLQSGSAGVLARMNRKYTPEAYKHAVALLRQHFQNPAITTDLIAGFPQETEEEHQETLAFIKDIGFSRIHVFPYSEREGTRAATMPGAVPKAVRKRRAQELIEAGREMAAVYAAGFLGKRENVLLEERREAGICVGHNERYMVVLAQGEPDTLVQVEITQVNHEGELLGTRI